MQTVVTNVQTYISNKLYAVTTSYVYKHLQRLLLLQYTCRCRQHCNTVALMSRSWNRTTTWPYTAHRLHL